MQMMPGDRVYVRKGLEEMEMKVAAMNHEGKLILHPLKSKETTQEMMMRLQSTVKTGG